MTDKALQPNDWRHHKRVHSPIDRTARKARRVQTTSRREKARPEAFKR